MTPSLLGDAHTEANPTNRVTVVNTGLGPYGALAPAYEILVTLVTKLVLPVVGSGKPHMVLVVQGSVIVVELWQDCERVLVSLGWT